MKAVELALEPTNGYLLSIMKDTFNGWWELEVGLPNNWVYSDNDMIVCKIINENEKGKLVKISPNKVSVSIDDLITYVVILIETNKKIEEKESEFKKKIEELKITLEQQAKDFYQELDVMREDSFKNVGGKFGEKQSDTIKPKNSKSKNKVDGEKTSTENVEDVN